MTTFLEDSMLTGHMGQDTTFLEDNFARYLKALKM
jgi:hypothetical protein